MSDYVATHMSAAERVLQVRQRPKLHPPELLEDLAEAWTEGYEHGWEPGDTHRLDNTQCPHHGEYNPHD